jgi:hypothetical protein
MSAFRDCLFSIFAATLHIRGRSSICTQRMRRSERDPLITARMYESTKFGTEGV